MKGVFDMNGMCEDPRTAHANQDIQEMVQLETVTVNIILFKEAATKDVL